jgi:enoyl-CoA hydratase
MHIKSEIKDSTLEWRLDRPDRRNALGTSLAKELWIKVCELQRDLSSWPHSVGAPRVLAIRALTDQADKSPIWIAGGDLQELNKLKEPSAGREYAKLMSDVCLTLQSLPIPVVALIDGLVIGGGIEFALAADFRFATERSHFHFKQLELGLSTAYASAGRLSQLVGASRAMSWLVRSSRVTAQGALEAGLITELVNSEQDLGRELQHLCRAIEPLNPRSIEAQKKLFRLHSSTAHVEAELDIFESLWMNDYHKRYLEGFLSAKGKKEDSAG